MNFVLINQGIIFIKIRWNHSQAATYRWIHLILESIWTDIKKGHKLLYGLRESFLLLGRMNSFYRANIRAGSAVSAYFSINFINIAGAYSFNRAFINTGTAGGAIFRNYVCHCKLFWLTGTKLHQFDISKNLKCKYFVI